LIWSKSKIDEVHHVIRGLVENEIDWKYVSEKYPKFIAQGEDNDD
jgi:hypothetical protein